MKLNFKIRLTIILINFEYTMKQVEHLMGFCMKSDKEAQQLSLWWLIQMEACIFSGWWLNRYQNTKIDFFMRRLDISLVTAAPRFSVF